MNDYNQQWVPDHIPIKMYDYNYTCIFNGHVYYMPSIGHTINIRTWTNDLSDPVGYKIEDYKVVDIQWYYDTGLLDSSNQAANMVHCHVVAV